MANDFSTMEYDPVTGTTKRKKALPYLSENETNQGRLPYTGNDIEQANINVMGTAQDTAIKKPASTDINDQTTAMTQKLMTDPNMGRDWKQYNAAQLSAFDADRASAIKDFKEQNTGMGGAGQVQNDLIKLALQQNTDRGLYSNQLDEQAYEKGIENYINALGQGREQGSYLDQSQTSYLDNLLKTRAAYEGERSQTTGQSWQSGENALDRTQALLLQSNDQAGQQALANIQGNIDLKKITTQQDWQTVQNSLDREIEKFKAEGDWDSAEKLVTLKGDIDTQINDANNAIKLEITSKTLESSEKIAGMEIASREKIAEDENYLNQQGIDLTAAGLYGYDREDGTHIYGTAELAGMKYDLESKDLENQTIELFGGMVDSNGDGILDKQIQGKYDLLSSEDKREADKLYGYNITDEDGNVIGSVDGTLQLENDRVAIEEQELSLNEAQVFGYRKYDGTYIPGELDLNLKKYGIDLEMMGISKDTAYGYYDEETGERIDGALETAMKDAVIRASLGELEKRQVDIKEIESNYELINNEIDAGRAAPGDAMKYLNGVFEEYGVKLTDADKDVVYKEIAQDFKVQQYQFALTNPDMAVYDENGNFTGLTEEGNTYFGKYINSTLYGDSTVPTIGGVDVSGYYLNSNTGKIYDGDGNDINYNDLSIAFRNADDPNNANYEKYTKFTTASPTINPRISKTGGNHLDVGAEKNQVVNAGGRLMIVIDKRRRGATDTFTIMDVATGKTGYFDGNTSGDDSVSKFNDWVNGLS